MLELNGVEGHALAMNCDLEGIEISTGSACSTGAIEPSSVLKAMGISDTINKSSIRISLGQPTTAEEINKVGQILPELAKQSKEGIR